MDSSENTQARKLNAAQVAGLLNGFDGDDMWEDLLDTFPGIDADYEASEDAHEYGVPYGCIIMLRDNRGAAVYTGKQWVGIAYPEDIRDPDAWLDLYRRLTAKVRAKRWRSVIRAALFINERKFAESMGWDELGDEEPRLQDTPVLTVSFYDDDYGRERHYVPRGWLAWTGLKRPVVMPEQFVPFVAPPSEADASYPV